MLAQASTDYELAVAPVRASVPPAVDGARRRLVASIGLIQMLQESAHNTVLQACAEALVWTGALPDKITPIVRPLMSALRVRRDALPCARVSSRCRQTESIEALQSRAGDALAMLLWQLSTRVPCPNDRIVANAAALLVVMPDAAGAGANASSAASTSGVLAAPNSTVVDVLDEVGDAAAEAMAAHPEVAVARRGGALAIRSLCAVLGGARVPGWHA